MKSVEKFETIMDPLFISNGIVDPNAETIFITCGDPRFQEGFEDFRINFLGLQNGMYCPIIKAGGPTPLAHPMKTKSRCKGLVRQVLLYRDLFPRLNRAVAIAHGGCGYYISVPPNHHNHGKEKRDLPLVGSLLKWLLPQCREELYYAELSAGGKRVGFEQLEASQEVVTVPEEWLISHEPLLAELRR